MLCVFVGEKKTITTENYHICWTIWTDVAVPKNRIHIFGP